MNNKRSKLKAGILCGALAMAVMLPSVQAQADDIFFDNFSEFSPLSPSYTNNSIPTYTSSLNQIAWTSIIGGSHGNYAFGLSTISVDYSASAATAVGTPLYAYSASYSGGLKTSILTSSGTAVDVDPTQDYTLSFDLGDRASIASNNSVLELLAGGTVIGSQTYDATVGTVGKFTYESFTVTSSTLETLGASGALSIDVLANDTTNPGYHTDFTNVKLVEFVPSSAPEPNSFALALGGLVALLMVHRVRHGIKV